MPRYQLKRYSLARKRDITSNGDVSYTSANGELETTRGAKREGNQNITKKNI